MIDWASAKESPGAGLAPVQKLAAMFDFIYSIGGSEMTSKVLPAFGFVECTKEWKGVRPLRPVRQILTHQTRNWKLAPRLLRNWAWARPKGASSFKSWKAIKIRPQEISPELYLSTNVAEAGCSPRPPGFFEYLLRCPIARFSLYGIVDGGEPQGHFAISVLRGQARIAGAWLRQPTQEAWTAAYFLAAETALGLKGAYEIVAAGSGGPSRHGADQAGLRTVEGAAVYLLNKKRNLTLSPEFPFQFADNDAAFIDAGTASYWS